MGYAVAVGVVGGFAGLVFIGVITFGGKLFCQPDGTPMHPETTTRRFNKLVDRAGVPRIRLHDVRHTYATIALDSGVDLKIVSERLAHANMTVTAQIYTHRSTGNDASAAAKIAEMIFNPSTRN